MSPSELITFTMFPKTPCLAKSMTCLRSMLFRLPMAPLPSILSDPSFSWVAIASTIERGRFILTMSPSWDRTFTWKVRSLRSTAGLSTFGLASSSLSLASPDESFAEPLGSSSGVWASSALLDEATGATDGTVCGVAIFTTSSFSLPKRASTDIPRMSAKSGKMEISGADRSFSHLLTA